MIGIDILYDELSPGELEAAAAWVKKNKSPYTGVFAGARWDQAPDYARYLVEGTGTTVILRNINAAGGNPNIAKDDGIHTRMSADEWFQRHCAPYKNRLDTALPKIKLMTDNESARPDMNVYADWMARAMDLAGAAGIGIVVGRTATGNPGESQYAQMDSMWRGLAKWKGLHLYSPNEYHAQTAQLSGGHVFRYHAAWERCKQLGITNPVTVIGEYGYLHSSGGRLDPESGWRRNGLSGGVAADMDIGYDRNWYAPYNVFLLAYAWCGFNTRWKDLNVNDGGWLDTITAYNATQKWTTPPVITPPTPPTSPTSPTSPTPPTAPPLDWNELAHQQALVIQNLHDAAEHFKKAGDQFQVALLSAELVAGTIADQLKKLKG